MTPTSDARFVAPTGVLLAAGAGRRMGGGKLLRAWPRPTGGSVPLVVAALDVIRPVCDRLVVVTGATKEGAAVREVLTAAAATADGDRPAIQLIRAASDAPMLHSIIAGLRAALDARPDAGVLLHLGDVPRVAPSTVAAVLDAASSAGDAGGEPAAVMPEYAGRGGHPAWLPARIAAAIGRLDGDRPGGLRRWWEEHPASARRLPVDDPGCRMDLDTPEDWDAAVAAAGAAPAPESEERCTR